MLAEAGDTTTAGQVLARLALPEGGTLQVHRPRGGRDRDVDRADRQPRLGQGRGAVHDRGASEYRSRRPGARPLDIREARGSASRRRSHCRRGRPHGKVRRIGTDRRAEHPAGEWSIIGISSQKRLLLNASGRALIKTGQSCNVAVPLTSVQYSTAGTVVQVIRRNRVETKRVEIGLMSGGKYRGSRWPQRRRYRRRPRRRDPARRRSGAPGDGHGSREVSLASTVIASEAKQSRIFPERPWIASLRSQ